MFAMGPDATCSLDAAQLQGMLCFRVTVLLQHATRGQTLAWTMRWPAPLSLKPIRDADLFQVLCLLLL